MRQLGRFLQIGFLIPVLLVLAACSNSKKSSTKVTTTTSGNYMANGICYSSAGVAYPNTSYCNQSGTYVLENGICYYNQNGARTPVNITSCQSQGAGTTCTTVGVCSGRYWWQNTVTTFPAQWVQTDCNAATNDCRNFTLVCNGQYVYCQ